MYIFTVAYIVFHTYYSNFRRITNSIIFLSFPNILLVFTNFHPSPVFTLLPSSKKLHVFHISYQITHILLFSLAPLPSKGAALFHFSYLIKFSLPLSSLLLPNHHLKPWHQFHFCFQNMYSNGKILYRRLQKERMYIFLFMSVLPQSM